MPEMALSLNLSGRLFTEMACAVAKDPLLLSNHFCSDLNSNFRRELLILSFRSHLFRGLLGFAFLGNWSRFIFLLSKVRKPTWFLKTELLEESKGNGGAWAGPWGGRDEGSSRSGGNEESGDESTGHFGCNEAKEARLKKMNQNLCARI